MRNKVRLVFLLMSMGFVHCMAQTFALEIKNDSLIYHVDEKGNRILDFSYCGYQNSEVPIPDVLNKVFVDWNAGDNSERIQKAIDYVSALPLDKNGFRGAVLLDKGIFELDNSLFIKSSGVVLRGMSKNQTVLKKNGVDRGALIYVEGLNDVSLLDTMTITSTYVPVNATTLQLDNTSHLKIGDCLRIIRPSTKEWIESIGCNIHGGGISALGWKPGDVDLMWNRTIRSIHGNEIVIDSPLTMAIDEQWGGGYAISYIWKGCLSNVGIENLTLESAYNNVYPKDEDHAWTGISIDNAENCWVRKVDFKHFAGSAVLLQAFASTVTVEDCIATNPISELGGMRRQTFLTLGQLNLFQRCFSQNGIHDFAAGYNAPGPNAFVQCEAKETNGFSGSVGALAPGLLFDVVDIDGNNLTYKNLGQHKNGAGWNTANSMFWQSTASEIECYSPAQDALKRAYGCWAQFSGDGEWAQSNNHIRPRSLFYAQLNQRLGRDTAEQARVMPLNTNSTSSPTVEQAAIMAKEALLPRLQLVDWIGNAPFSADTIRDNITSIDKVKTKRGNQINRHSPIFAITNGRLTADGAILTGGKHDVPWWNGNLKNTFLPKSKIHITRFVPGREGKGLTDRIASIVNYLVANDLLVLDHNYGLWYERLSADHERIRRTHGDACGPFCEQPFAPSGEGRAW